MSTRGRVRRGCQAKLAEESVRSLETGDIVLFAETSATGEFMHCVLGTPWSHVGLVYRPSAAAVATELTTCNHAEAVPAQCLYCALQHSDGPLLFESVRIRDDLALAGGDGAGVRLVRLAERIASGAHCEKVCARKLVFASRELETAHRAHIERALLYGEASLQRLLGRPYETSISDLVRSYLGGTWWWRACGLAFVCASCCGDEDEDADDADAERRQRSIFCTELVAAVYRCSGLLRGDGDGGGGGEGDDMYTPVDFASNRRSRLRFRRGVSLGRQRLLAVATASGSRAP